ncbi:sulfotransferase [Methylorubrum sp. SB2]|uniref:sulfotransferase family protein n=1 Tax=Methylorubrum subtropicum TaxID=3138812 RepID=UPI00313D1CCB
MNTSINPATLGASPPPFFIVGCPRSGTTLLSVLMNRHSKIAVTPETAFYEDTATWPWPCDPSTLRRLLSEWPRLSELRLDADAVVAACPEPSGAAEVLATILSLYSGSLGKPICGEKTPQHLWHAGRILEDFPDSPVFCLVRDGRDVALSLAAMPWWNADLRGAAHYWIDAVEQARRLNAAYPERFVVIRYEHLVTKPGETLGAIMARLDLPFEARQLVADEAEATPVILPRSHAWKGMAAGPIDPGRIGFRRKTSGDEEDARLDAWLGPTLESLGYGAFGAARSIADPGIPASGRDAGVAGTSAPASIGACEGAQALAATDRLDHDP